MHLAILHFHLDRGGVSQVVANHLRALAAVGADIERVLLIHGPRVAGWDDSIAEELPFPIEHAAMADLEYDDAVQTTPTRIAQQVRGALDAAGCRPDQTVLHLHNHGLGKNISVPPAVVKLARDGWRLLLQIHDFAEDFRHDVYGKLLAAEGVLPRVYPQAEHVHYAVLNRRDHDILRAAGVPEGQVHLLPNPVAGLAELPPQAEVRPRLARLADVASDSRLLLYPIRGIARKNLGEAILWSQLVASDEGRVGVTLPAVNPREVPRYQEWAELAADLRPPCRFGLGAIDGVSYADLIAGADLILTTSVAEGFGMAYLEPWLNGLALAGRDLPDITVDFQDAGVTYNLLAPRLDVPIEWIGQERWLTEFSDVYRRVVQAYRRSPPSRETYEEAARSHVNEQGVDFGSLTVSLQREVIARLRTDQGARDAMSERNPQVGLALAAASDPATESIAANRQVVEERYSLAVCGQRLSELLEQTLGSQPGDVQCDDGLPGKVLDQFLDPARFRPVRVLP